MSAHLFKSMNGHAVPFEPTAEEMASDLAMEMIACIKERRLVAQAKELACEPSEPWHEADQAAYTTIETLLKGRHRPTVLRLVLEHFPELVAQMKVQ